jgi:glycosyltransferase involved in cell wall biosynthesis
MKIAVVHYHARPGGVTRVVERAVESLGERAQCLFFTGEAARGDTPLQKKIRVLPNLGYSSDKKFQPLELLKRARGAFADEPDLWHFHNHSLGKNPALTQEVTSLAMAGRKILLQIHDFAEDGRPDNYLNLGKLKGRLYPVAPHIHYAVLNKRDYRFLNAAGIPETNLHLLPNAVSALPSPKYPEPRTPGAELLYVYPCRAIRRKNLGELMLWSALMPEVKFAVTLAPKNPEVKPIYDAWIAFAQELELNVELNAGADTPFHKMILKADALITTSVAEGFGLAFLEPWLANKPLTGRNLPEITGDFAERGLDLSALYDRLPVPLISNAWNIQDEFFQTLEKALRTSREAYGRAWCDVVFEEAKSALVQDGCADFGILDEEMQRTIIRAVKNDPSLLGFSLGNSSAVVETNRTVTETAYGPQAYGDQLFSIYEQLLKAKAGTVTYADSEKLLDEFLQPQRFNLLRT